MGVCTWIGLVFASPPNPQLVTARQRMILVVERGARLGNLQTRIGNVWKMGVETSLEELRPGAVSLESCVCTDVYG